MKAELPTSLSQFLTDLRVRSLINQSPRLLRLSPAKNLSDSLLRHDGCVLERRHRLVEQRNDR